MNSALSPRRSLVALLGTMLLFLSVVATAQSGGGGGGGAGGASQSQAGAAQGAVQSSAAGGGSAANPSPASGTSGPTNGTVFLRATNPTLYVLTFGGDPTTTNFLAYEVSTVLQAYVIRSKAAPPLYGKVGGAISENLRANLPKYPNDPHVTSWITPEPAWSLLDFAFQCQNDANTIGALILFDVENNAGSTSYLLFQQGYVHLYARAALVTCHWNYPPLPKLSGVSDASPYTSTGSISAQSTVLGVPVPSPFPTGITQATTSTTNLHDTNTISCTKQSDTVPKASPAPTSTHCRGGVTKTVQQHVNDTLVTSTSPPAPTAQITQTTTWIPIPSMTIDWQNTSEISGSKGNGVVPFLTFAALGAYVASRQETVSNTTAVTLPNTPGQNTGSTSYTHSTSENNSNLPFGLALLGTSFSQLGSGSVGAINPAAMLKYAASEVAVRVAQQLRAQWYGNGIQTINDTFDFNQWGPLPKETPEPPVRPYP
jgi:hypothetical protein